MKTKSRERFLTVRSEGGLLPLDFMEKIARLDSDVSGLIPESYHLFEHEKINEAINRAWERMLGCWVSFKSAISDANANDSLMKETRERWLLPLFDALGYGRLVGNKAVDVEGKSFPISHFWQNTPIHLIGRGVELDRRTSGITGAAKSAPHGMVQEFLNRSDAHLWAFLSNGKKLRILRDNVSLTRQSFVEFDLEGMMDGEQFSDFRLLWLLCHESRVESEKPDECWLEKWSKAALESGIRVRDQLRSGVEEAINLLGSGFLRHPQNSILRNKLRTGELSSQDYYRQLLRIVYRLLFLFVTEERDLLLLQTASPKARDAYFRYYSTRRVRELAGLRKGSQHIDLLQSLRLVFDALGSDNGCPELALPALGSFLWYKSAVPDIHDCIITNRDLLDAIRALAYAEEGRARRAVDFKNLRSEELGSIYEALLELHPHVDMAVARFRLTSASGSERKTTGSYYTPTVLVSCLLDSGIDPLISKVARLTDAKNALLELKICDPACGSGHFLIAAAHRIAKALASARTEDVEPSPEAYRDSLRDVISRCIYGVDINEMSVELCKVSLWLESIDPGKPLAYLDHKIKCGNSLLGATPGLIEKGIVDDAFDPIEGDEKDYARLIKKANKEQSQGQIPIFSAVDRSDSYRSLCSATMRIGAIPDSSLTSLHQKETSYEGLLEGKLYNRERFICDAWCSTFVWNLVSGTPHPITRAVFSQLLNDYQSLPLVVRAEVERLRKQYKFFHWHIEFPDVFYRDTSNPSRANSSTWSSGFDAVIGNPPWEKVKLQENEWFSARSEEIAAAKTAAERKRLIKGLRESNPSLYAEYLAQKRISEGESHFIRKSNRFPLCGGGDINTYAIFVEASRFFSNSNGRVGVIVPPGIATSDTYKMFFQDVVRKQQLISFFEFVNRESLFRDIEVNVKFAVLILSHTPQDQMWFAAQLWNPTQLKNPERVYALTVQDLEKINPNTLNCPSFRTNRDASIVKSIYEQFGILLAESEDGTKINPWGISFDAMFHMTNDSGFFRTMEELLAEGFILTGNIFADQKRRFVPLYEWKLCDQYNHRAASFLGIPKEQRFRPRAKTVQITESDLADPNFVIIPRYWIPEEEAVRRSGDRKYLMGFRNVISAVSDSRSLTVAVTPLCGVGNSMPLVLLEGAGWKTGVLLACLNSLVVDYVLRQKASGANLNFFIVKQLPMPEPTIFSTMKIGTSSAKDWILERVVELVCTTSDLSPFCLDMIGSSSVFKWDEDRRFKIQCELDALLLHVFGINSPSDAEYIMDSFPVVRTAEISKFGAFRTKETVLSVYSSLSNAISLE